MPRESISSGGGSPPSALKPEPPAWVKPNTAPPAAEQPPRKPRSQAFVRKRETATEEGVYSCSHCPDCGRSLAGGTQYSRWLNTLLDAELDATQARLKASQPR